MAAFIFGFINWFIQTRPYALVPPGGEDQASEIQLIFMRLRRRGIQLPRARHFLDKPVILPSTVLESLNNTDNPLKSFAQTILITDTMIHHRQQLIRRMETEINNCITRMMVYYDPVIRFEVKFHLVNKFAIVSSPVEYYVELKTSLVNPRRQQNVHLFWNNTQNRNFLMLLSSLSKFYFNRALTRLSNGFKSVLEFNMRNYTQRPDRPLILRFDCMSDSRIQMDMLFNFYNKFDPRFGPVAAFVNWHFTNQILINRVQLTNEFLNMIVAYYLEQKKILPNVQQMIDLNIHIYDVMPLEEEDSDDDDSEDDRTYAEMIDGDCTFPIYCDHIDLVRDDVDIQRNLELNNYTSEELIVGFFHYYRHFGWQQLYIKPLTNQILSKTTQADQTGMLIFAMNASVEDPFNRNRNLAERMDETTFALFKETLARFPHDFFDNDMRDFRAALQGGEFYG